MIKAIWPSIARMPNHIPLRAGITSSGLLCYFIYWLVQFPFMLLSPQKLRWLFFVKTIVVPITWLAMVIWSFVRVPPSNGLFTEHATITGTQFSWSWLSALNSVLGIYATLSVNIPDFTVRLIFICHTKLIDIPEVCEERESVRSIRKLHGASLTTSR